MGYHDILLGDLPAFFDKDPAAEPILIVQSVHELRWQVADNVLRLTVGETAHDLVLDTYTIGTLAEFIREQYLCTVILPELSATEHTATVLIDGAGGPAQTILMTGYNSLLWTYLRALARPLDTAAADVTAAIAQLDIRRSYQDWADYWGAHFGVRRATGETDADYAVRIIDEVWRKRNNDLAIEANIQRYTGATVDLFEPWRQMHILSRHRCSSAARLPGAYYAYHVLHPITEQTVDWPAVLAVIEADRPAGTVVWPPLTRRSGQIIDLQIGGVLGQNGQHFSSRLHQRHFRLIGADWLSVNLTLSGQTQSHIPALNYGTQRAGAADPILPDGTLVVARTQTTFEQTVLFDSAAAGWVGHWDATTWNERSAGIAIPVLSQHTSYDGLIFSATLTTSIIPEYEAIPP